MPGATSRLSLYKPGGGSTGTITPDEVADIDKLNDNFDDIDAAVGAFPCTSSTRPSSPFQGQIIRESDTGKVLVFIGSDWVDVAPGIILIGTTAQRDAAYPTPGSASARVTQANKITRFFNTDKGYEQQYFAQFDDAGATATTPTRTTHGWAPSMHLGRVPLKPSSVASTGGTAAILHGGKVVCTANTAINLNGVFTGDFDNYEVIISGALSSSGLLGIRLRAAGVDFAGGTAHAYQTQEANNTAVAATRNVASDRWYASAINSQDNLESTVLFQRPATTDARKRYRADSVGVIGTNPTLDRIGGFLVSGSAYDGFSLIPSAGGFTGTVRVYGINDY